MEPGGDGGPSKKSEGDAATFKVPYPYKNPPARLPLQPTARRLATLYQPWTQTQTQTQTSAGRTSGPGLPQHPWPGWAQGFPQLYGGPDPSQGQGPLAGHARDFFAGSVQQGAPLRYPLKLIPVTVLPEVAERPATGYRMEAPRSREGPASVGFSAPGGDRGGPWGRRSDQQTPHGSSPTSLTPHPFLIPSLPPVEDVKPDEERLYVHLVGRGAKHPTAPRLASSSSSSSSSSSQGSSCGYNAQQEAMSFQTERKPVFGSSSPPASSSITSTSSSTSPGPFPWLLPHFAAGSLIELRDGRLKRVEDLETEDFLLGSAARRGLQLSCCTVQSITSSSSSSSCPASLSRLLILLHNQNSQELVDVYVEYPFFVRGRGWSSCCPERTARLCGLTCGQLSVGDVCLALIPAAPGGAPLPGEAGARRCTAKEQDRNTGLDPAQGQDSQQGPVSGE